jgi:hypothetical protein
MSSHIINLPQMNIWQDFLNPAYAYTYMWYDYDLNPKEDIFQETVHAYKWAA